jgi:uncharacterized membrane protein (DUF2068 family)
MTSTPAQLRNRSSHDQWIIAIGVFKLLQAALFILLGLGAVRLLHRDLMRLAEHLILAMRFNPEGRFVNLFLEKVAMIDPHRLRQISAVIFAIAGLDIIEGTGLVLEQAWAEFVILRHVTWIRVALVVINLAVVLYLLYYVKLRIQERRQRRAGRA